MGSPKPKVVKRLTFAEALDEAASAQFPGVVVETHWNIFAMQMVTTWTDSLGDKLTPSKARRVKDFVEGFSAGWAAKDANK